MDLSLTSLDWIVFVLTTLGSISLGLYLSMRLHSNTTSSGFFLAGKHMIWPVVGASLFATNIGAEHLVGLSGDVYRYGICAGTIEVCALCLGIAAAFLFPYYLRNKVFTIPEFLEMRYTPESRLFFSGFMILVTVVMKMALVLFAGALVLQSLLGLDVMTTVVMIGLAGAVITITGGFAAVAYTDTIQTTIMITGCSILLFLGLHEVGGWSALMERAPEAMRIAKPYNDPNFPFWGVVALSFYAGIFYWGVDQTNVQRVLGAASLHHARWGAMFAIFLKLSVIFIFALPGVIASVLYPGNDPRMTFAVLLRELMPSGLRGLVLAALIAAIVSSLDGAMNSISTLVVRDFVLRVRPGIREWTQVLLGRLAILLSVVFGIGAAYLVYITPGGVYKYFQTLGAYLFIPITPAIVFGIMSRRVTALGAGISVIVGVICSSFFLTDEFMGPARGAEAFPWLHTDLTTAYSYRGLWGFLLITAVLFGVSAFTEKTAPEKLEKTTVDWSLPAEPFAGWSDWRLHFAGLTVLTAALYVALW